MKLFILSLMTFLISFSAFSSSEFEVRKMLENGGSVVVGSTFTPFEMKRFIGIGKSRVTTNCSDFTLFECRQFITAGAGVILTSQISEFEIRKIIPLRISPATVSVVADGFSAFDLKRFSELGAILIINN